MKQQRQHDYMPIGSHCCTWYRLPVPGDMNCVKYLVLISKVSQEEEIGRLGPLELSRVPDPFLASRGFGVIPFIVCHDNFVVCLQDAPKAVIEHRMTVIQHFPRQTCDSTSSVPVLERIVDVCKFWH